MSIEGWYYLHINGSLIYKRELGDTVADIRESDFARCIWPVDPSDREGAWNIVVEGLALGADKSSVDELAAKWGCNDDDAEHYARALLVTLQLDGNMWCATGPGFQNIQESPAGFGATKLEAIAELAKALKLKDGKMWRMTLRDLLIGLATAEELRNQEQAAKSCIEK